MRPFKPLLLAFALFALSGCAHYVWVKPAGDPASYPADNYACKQESLNVAPPVYQVYEPYSSGPDIVRTDCVQNGPRQRCYARVVSEGYQPPPQAVDLNRGNRSDLYNACMNARGWVLQRVEDPE